MGGAVVAGANASGAGSRWRIASFSATCYVTAERAWLLSVALVLRAVIMPISYPRDHAGRCCRLSCSRSNAVLDEACGDGHATDRMPRPKEAYIGSPKYTKSKTSIQCANSAGTASRQCRTESMRLSDANKTASPFEAA